VVAWLLSAPAPLAAQTESVEYYVTDAIGSVRVVFDAAGTVLGRMDYAPFGEELYTGLFLPSERFAELTWDGEAGQDYAEARMYLPRAGRFSTPDPINGGLFRPQRWNRYSYAMNNPLVWIDPTGLTEGKIPSCGEILKMNPYDWICNSGGGAYGSYGGGNTSSGSFSGSGNSPAGGSHGSGSGSGSSSASGTNTNSNTNGENPTNNPGNECHDHVLTLTLQLQTFNLPTAVPGTSLGTRIAGALIVGAGMAARGVIDGHYGISRGRGLTGEGFRPVLTTPAQGPDVYRHLDFVAGFTVLGRPEPVQWLISTDLDDLAVGRRSAIPELAGDLAGLALANEMVRATLNADYPRFAATSMRLLCKP
jgi:RHS repeat-associated protein